MSEKRGEKRSVGDQFRVKISAGGSDLHSDHFLMPGMSIVNFVCLSNHEIEALTGFGCREAGV